MKICEFTKRTRAGKNSETDWNALVHRLSTPTVTPETAAEYAKMSKAEQSDVKDVGGFVGGYVRGGKRSKETVEYRELICLDMDFAEPDYAEKIDDFLSPYKYLVYPTHKFTPQKPRVRVVIPTSRPVQPEEYEPIARFVADQIGIELFDDTTYQFERLMFYPSVPKDISYEPIIGNGNNLLDPDLVLSFYDDWHDVSTWPVSVRQAKIIRTTQDKQADPLTKSGVVGAFCREYSISEAIENFLPEVYEDCGGDRFTYKGGTTFGGLVVYDDKFAYSHHSTDPAAGQLCNSFDLVRLHTCNPEEDNEDAPPNRKQSYRLMTDMALEDPKVKRRLILERQQSAEEDFAEELEGEGWEENLKVNKSGVPLSTIANVVLILENDPRFKGQIGGYDEMKNQPFKAGRMPWDGKNWSKAWLEDDDANLRCLLENEYGIVGVKKIDDAILSVQKKHAYHPIRDYLSRLEWDGESRVETVFIDYLGVPDTHYARTVTRKFFAAAVSRVMVPGCKWDYMPMLVGDQGIGKSRLIRALFTDEYTNDSLSTLSGKTGYEALDGTWCVEMAEMTLFRKADVEAYKQYISSPSDKYRKAYDKRAREYPRQCVFIGTTNDTECLKDYTGNRRFWPLACRKSGIRKDQFTELTSTVRGQIWAEAVQIYNDQEPLYMTSQEEEEALAAQEKHMFIPDRWVDISNYLNRLLPIDWYEKDVADRVLWLTTHKDNEGEMRRDKVCTKEIWAECFGRSDKTFGNSEQRDIKACLTKLGWKPTEKLINIPGYGYQRGMVREGD